MRKTTVIIITATMLLGLVACNNSEQSTAKLAANALTAYVDSVNNLTPVYTVANWSAIDSGYQVRAMESEKTMATLDSSDRLQANASKEKYATLRTNYETKLKAQELQVKSENAIPDSRQLLRSRLFGEGIIGADMKFSAVTAKNILDVYKHFVNTVDDNKKNYSREDWDEIKVLYEALDTRKNAVEKDLASSDNLKIAGLKIKFATIKSLHRGGTKAEENEKAKQ